LRLDEVDWKRELGICSQPPFSLIKFSSNVQCLEEIDSAHRASKVLVLLRASEKLEIEIQNGKDLPWVSSAFSLLEIGLSLTPCLFISAPYKKLTFHTNLERRWFV